MPWASSKFPRPLSLVGLPIELPSPPCPGLPAPSKSKACPNGYGVATISRHLKIIGLFCKRDLYKRRYSAKETYNFKESTNCSHPIVDILESQLYPYLIHGIIAYLMYGTLSSTLIHLISHGTLSSELTFEDLYTDLI